MQVLIDQLTQRFEQIAIERMQGLPFYNDQLHVEALGFKDVDQGYIGALITPWFINIIFLFKQQPQTPVITGHKYTHMLRSGDHDFMIGEDEQLGRYDFISLASPTSKYKSQQLARVFAQQKLDTLLAPPGKNFVDEQPMVFVDSQDASLSRRSFLTGRNIPGPDQQ